MTRICQLLMFHAMWVDKMEDQFSTYIYQKRGFFYFVKRIPKQLLHCHGKQRIVFALPMMLRAGISYGQTIGKIERHTGLYIDEYQVGDADIKVYGSLETIQI